MDTLVAEIGLSDAGKAMLADYRRDSGEDEPARR